VEKNAVNGTKTSLHACPLGGWGGGENGGEGTDSEGEHMIQFSDHGKLHNRQGGTRRVFRRGGGEKGWDWSRAVLGGERSRGGGGTENGHLFVEETYDLL